jgi:GntR family transcriptional regulator, trigonelline degradation regulator
MSPADVPPTIPASLTIERVTATLREQVVRKLRSALIEGVFRPGDRMVERDICERLDVSRTLVREALRQLEAEGLVELVPHRGPVVRRLTPEEAAELYDLMAAVEGECARYCARRATDADLALLRERTEALVDALLARDTARIVQGKHQYYDALFAACHCPSIASYLRQISAQLSQFWSSSVHVPGRVEEGSAELLAILDAIERRDEAAAAEAAQIFIRHARRQQDLRAAAEGSTRNVV